MSNEKSRYGVVEGVLVYAKIAQSDKKYQSNDEEYSIGVIVDEDTADAWDENFKKQSSKKIKAAEFEAKFKIPCPIEGAKNVYHITLKKDATKDGEPLFPEYRPRVFLDKNDGERVDITESRLIANGSKGKVSYRINENDFGTFAKLNNVLVTEDGFKEYVATGGKAGDEFGAKPVVKETARKEATQARPKKEAETTAKPEAKEAPKKAKAAPNFSDIDDQDIPF